MNEQPPCVECKKTMPVEWLKENCPCVERKAWEQNQEVWHKQHCAYE
jgi:hypothetical protein